MWSASALVTEAVQQTHLICSRASLAQLTLKQRLRGPLSLKYLLYGS